MAVIEGIILVLTIRPGYWTQSFKIKSNDNDICMSKAVDTILDLLRNLFPENLVQACTQSLKTCSQFVNVTLNELGNKTSETLTPQNALRLSPEERDRLQDIPKLGQSDGMNILGLVCFSCLFGFIISRMGEDGKPLMRFFRSLEGAMMRLISWVIWYSPIGITFLIAGQIVEMDDPKEELHRLTGYMITVLTGLAIHGLIVLPLLLVIFGRRNPITFVYGMLQALLTALGTSSSSATLPLSIKCLEENNGIDPRVTRFMLPLGATINMDGTALYEAVAAIYIAQTLRKTLSIGEVILVSLTATLASIGAAGIPQAGIVTMIMVLIAVGLPTQYFVLILPVDWFLDRIRTTVNVHGDSIGAGIVNKLCEAQLKAETEEMQRTPTEMRRNRPSIQVESDDEHRI